MRPTRSVVQTLLSPDDEVDPRVDLVELRLDLYPEADPSRYRKPAIVTVRRRRDGGRFEGGEGDRARLLARAAGAAFVDVEVDAEAALAPAGARRIVSYHDMAGVPDDLDGLFERCLLRGADRVKIAATPRSAREAFRLLDLPTAGLGMGDYGGFTRVLAPLTYCARAPLAPGMPTPEELFETYRVRRLSGLPRLFGVAGDPVGHSRSPSIHNPAFERDGLDAVYLAFRVGDLADFWPAFLAHGGEGLSVTAPLKRQAAALATRPSEEVRLCGAANTLLRDGRAFNTDYLAFLDLVPPGRGDALILGAGGSARAAFHALSRLGYRPGVWARRPGAVAEMGAPFAPRDTSARIVVNTLPTDPPRAPLLIDLRYGPGVASPSPCIDGVQFLQAQAAHQYRLFTGDAG